jgi:predicted amidohydrolase
VFGPGGGDRLADLRLIVAQASAFLSLLARGHAGALKVLLAPEYFFSEFAAYGSRVGGATATSLSREDKHAIYKELKRLSAAYPAILLFAGSILYTRSRLRGGTEGLNVCPVLYGGKIVFKHYKRGDDTILNEGMADANYRSKSNGNVFNAAGLSIGLEICLDHGELANDHASNLDLQVLLSAGASIKNSAIVTRTNGVVAHCDLNGNLPTAVRLMKFNGNSATRQPEIASSIVSCTSVGGIKIECYLFAL